MDMLEVAGSREIGLEAISKRLRLRLSSLPRADVCRCGISDLESERRGTDCRALRGGVQLSESK